MRRSLKQARADRSRTRSKSRGKNSGSMSSYAFREHIKQMDQRNQMRETLKSTVIHFESPPKRRLRQQQTKAIEVYYESVSPVKLESMALTPKQRAQRANETVDRLMMSN